MIDLNWLLVVTGTALPMIVALTTAQVANAGLKAVTLAALAAVGGVGNELVSVGGNVAAFDWSASGANALTVFLIGVGLHYGLLKPAGLTGSSGSIQSSVTGGIGASAGLHKV